MLGILDGGTVSTKGTWQPSPAIGMLGGVLPLLTQSVQFRFDSALTPIAILAALGSLAHPELVLFSLPLIGLLAHFARDRKSHIDKALELSNAYRGTAFLLGDVVEADDAYTGLHSQDVVSLVLAVGDELKLGPDERRSAEFTAILHDVGKIKIPKEIINKPGPLTDEERAIINTHTIEGQRMLEKVGGLLGEVGYLVRSCHERWDGAGYPDGLAGEQTPLVSRNRVRVRRLQRHDDKPPVPASNVTSRGDRRTSQVRGDPVRPASR